MHSIKSSSLFKSQARQAVTSLFYLLIALSLFSTNYLRFPSVTDFQSLGFPSITLQYCHSSSGLFDTKEDKSKSHQSECCTYCSLTKRVAMELTPIFSNYYILSIPIILINFINLRKQPLSANHLNLGILTSWSAHSPPSI